MLLREAEHRHVGRADCVLSGWSALQAGTLRWHAVLPSAATSHPLLPARSPCMTQATRWRPPLRHPQNTCTAMDRKPFAMSWLELPSAPSAPPSRRSSESCSAGWRGTSSDRMDKKGGDLSRW